MAIVLDAVDDRRVDGRGGGRAGRTGDGICDQVGDFEVH